MPGEPEPLDLLTPAGPGLTAPTHPACPGLDSLWPSPGLPVPTPLPLLPLGLLLFLLQAPIQSVRPSEQPWGLGTMTVPL